MLDDGSAGTLRERVADVQQGNVPDNDNTIIFDSSLNGGTIQLSSTLDLGHTIIIDASAAPDLSVDVSGMNSVFKVVADDIQIDLEAFTITGGESVGNGGAIDVDGSRSEVVLTLRNMEISNNSATGDGGGISFGAEDSRIEIIDSVIMNNHSGNRGGGIATAGMGPADSFSVALVLTRTEVVSNSAVASGGGVFFKANLSTVEIIDSLISNNEVGDSAVDFNRDGAGLAVIVNKTDGSTFTAVMISGSTISDNKNFGDSDDDETTHSTGGGASLKVTDADIEIIRSTITGNIADHGGGLYGYVTEQSGSATIKIVDSTLDDNEARDDGGGALICAKIEGSAEIVNSTVSGNRAGDLDGTGRGGGLYFAVADPNEILNATITNSTITDNEAPNVASGGGVFIKPAEENLDVEANNSVISLNLTPSGSNANIGTAGGDLEPTSANNYVGSDGSGGLVNGANGNQVGDAPSINDLAFYGGPTKTHLPKPGSPLLNNGNNAKATESGLTLDQRGLPRFLAIVDIGSVEGTEAAPPPQVIDVTLSSSDPAVLHPAYSFSDQAATGSGIQLKTVPVAQIDVVSVTFDKPVTASAASATMSGNFGYSGTPQHSADPGNLTHHWTFNSTTVRDEMTFTLTAATVLDSLQQQLDGEWDPAPTFASDPDCGNSACQTFPSGDQTAGGDFVFSFGIIAGDADLNNEVEFADFLTLSANFGNSGSTWETGDFDGDGTVGFPDFLLLSANFGKSVWLPTSSAASSGGGSSSSSLTAGSATAAQGNSNGSAAGGDLWSDRDREIAVVQFRSLVSRGADQNILRMGQMLLHQMWASLDQEDWLDTERELDDFIDASRTVNSTELLDDSLQRASDELKEVSLS